MVATLKDYSAVKNCNILKSTPAAILIEINGPIPEHHWFPLSQVAYIKRSDKDWDSEVHVANWILKQKGLA